VNIRDDHQVEMTKSKKIRDTIFRIVEKIYDWGNPNNEVGVSEFVIQMGAKVTIHAISDTMDYCQQRDCSLDEQY